MASRLNKRVLASYSMVALPIGAMAMPIAIYLPPFYSGGLGLSLATVGLIFTLARKRNRSTVLFGHRGEITLRPLKWRA
jgi:Na+/melibiose symporter-like transporter